MTTYFCLLVSVLIGKNYAEMTCQTVQQKNTATLSCGHSEGNVTWSRDQNGGRVDILTVRKGQDSEDKHISDPGKRFSSGADKSLKMFKVISSDSGVYYCNGEPVVNLTVTSETVPEEHQKRTCGPKSPPTQNVTMTPHTTENPTTRVKNTDIATSPHTTKNPTTRVKNTGHWQLPVGVTTGGLVLVLVLLLVGFLIRRRWAQKAEGDRDRRLDHVYAEISDVTQQPKDESCECDRKVLFLSLLNSL
ncbi:uncharacterized protein LOC134040960 [Osmerus eperlanus]|uniref:uncharacterized protein LOC134040960 n=1 Tax=Osmerus eperlanus TaxID=29151 RepID=UPI002E0E60EE